MISNNMIDRIVNGDGFALQWTGHGFGKSYCYYKLVDGDKWYEIDFNNASANAELVIDMDFINELNRAFVERVAKVL